MRPYIAFADGSHPSRLLPLAGDARLLARRHMPRLVFDFIDGAAGSETSAELNQSDIVKLRLMPRGLIDVDNTELTKNFLGHTRGLPFGIAPMGMCNLARPGADAMLAAEAIRNEIPVGVSTACSTSLEDMHRLSGGRAWFQLYVTGSTEVADKFVDRAAAVGYEHLVLTIDVPKLGTRPRDLRNEFKTPFRMRPKQFLDFALHPSWSIATLMAGKPEMANYRNDGSQGTGYIRNGARGGGDWNYLNRLRDRWKGKLIVKGVMAVDDATGVKAAGVDAIWVSNHGGRQLDSSPSSISVLPGIRAAVGPDYPLILDSGVRSGEDIVKVLASGADYVMMGRPFLYAIGAGGAPALQLFVDNLAGDVAATLGQIGLRRVEDISASILDCPQG